MQAVVAWCTLALPVIGLRPLDKAVGLELASVRALPLNIGHRGAAGEAPENTLPAFELALAQGADGIEFDVQLSRDGVPVVIHDPTLDRTTPGSGRVCEHNISALRRLDAGSWFNTRHPARARSRYKGSKIPLLLEVLEWVRDKQCLAFLEIKEGGDVYPGIEAKILDAIDRAGIMPLITVISFNLPTLRRLRRMDSRIALGIDYTRPVLAVRRARSIGAKTLLPHWAFASWRLLSRAHRAGIQILVWDLDQPRWMRRKISDGVDGIVTDYPARLAEVLAGMPRRLARDRS